MKAGIITFGSAHNYGALLQAYASQKYLQNLGYDAYIINYRPEAIDKVYRLYKIKPTKSFVRRTVRTLKAHIKTKTKDKWKITKYNNFEEYINHTLNVTNKCLTLKDLKKSNFKFDVLIAGSDQIWNTELTGGFDSSYFLNFGKNSAVRIAYAASLGADDIDRSYEALYRNYLKKFDYVSVREKSMVDIFQPLADKEIEVTVDPTLLLDKSDFDSLKMKSRYENQKYIYAHFIGAEPKVTEFADWFSINMGVPVLHNRNQGRFENELDFHYLERPEQLISMVENAEMIISNSFHLTVLALIYHIPFITVPHKTRPERMRNLLQMVGLENRLIEDVRIMPDPSTLKIDWDDVDRRIKLERIGSVEFLNKALNNGKVLSKSNYFLSGDKFECCGCGLCKSICPKDAITMKADDEGFVYPVIDNDKCINCKLCERECIYHNPIKTEKKPMKSKVYAAVNKDKGILSQSSSGGAFSAMYKYVLSNGGYIVGVRYDKNMRAVYDISNNAKVCEEFRGAKYVAAYVGDIKERVKEKLDTGALVLFVGNPCQVSALKKYLKKDYDNLIITEFICHGTPSPKVFKGYIKSLEKKYKSKVVDVKFRDKRISWDNSCITVYFEDGTVKSEPIVHNNYTRAFRSKYDDRPSCYNCEFTGNTKQSDFTIGDFWGVKKTHPEVNAENGVSIIKINTKKGLDFFDNISDSLDLYESSYKEAYRFNHKSPIELTQMRFEFMNQIDDMDMDKLLLKYNTHKNKETSDKKVIDGTI